jgi:cysteinyl-tRNA synthetase
VPADPVPSEIVDLAEQRAAARRARDWPTADALRARIEASGWSIVDAGTLYTLHRTHAPDVTDGSVTRYGSSGAVPSRLDEQVTAPLTVVLEATDWPADLERAIRSVARHAPTGTELIVVANGPSPDQAARLDGLALQRDARDAPAGAGGQATHNVRTEVVWLAERLGYAAALNAGIRRATGAVVTVMDASVEVGDSLLDRLITGLDDPTVAVTGPFGLVSSDLRRFEEPEPAGGDQDVVAIEGYLQAFRRADYVDRGPLDEHFTFYRNLDIWWSLVLRDQLSDETDRPRRALALGGTTAARHEHRGWTSMPEADRERRSKRNFYRILKRFATRRDLLPDS